MFKLILRTELIKTRLLCITPLAGCSCSIRNIMQRPVTKLPAQSTKGTKLKRYDVPPSRIGVLKSWDSRHTGGLKGSKWAAERFHDDIMITKFIEGTFYEKITSDVIIKRRLNQIIICLFITGRGQEGSTAKVYFLKAFGEKLLSEMLGCIVKIELRTGPEFV